MVLALILALAAYATKPSIERNEDVYFQALQNEGLFEGDMILPSNYALRNGITGEDFRWPGYPGRPDIPYVIDETLENRKDVILQAMEIYHKSTCIRFVPRSTQKDYIKIFKGKGCYSVVGRDQYISQPQHVSLGPGCLNIGTIIHELGHTIGFYHEQNRSDRDDYLIIYNNNVTTSNWHNFRKLKPDQNMLLTPFDYESIMIYGNYAFSKHPFVDMTMEAKTGCKLRNPYEKESLTPSDIERVNKMYKCLQ